LVKEIHMAGPRYTGNRTFDPLANDPEEVNEKPACDYADQAQWGNLHETDLEETPPENLFQTYASHGGDPTPRDNNANGSPR
jgi:hypothetical protein